jgi:hypothetical protein
MQPGFSGTLWSPTKPPIPIAIALNYSDTRVKAAMWSATGVDGVTSNWKYNILQ